MLRFFRLFWRAPRIRMAFDVLDVIKLMKTWLMARVAGRVCDVYRLSRIGLVALLRSLPRLIGFVWIYP